MVALLLACLLAACDDGSSPAADAALVVPDAPAATADAAAALADAAPMTDAPEFGVRCGPANELCVPGLSQGCCSEAKADPYCSPLNNLCTGPLQTCDGPEDCPNGGELCCDYSFGPGCGAAADCNPGQGGTVQCHADPDCPLEQPMCCAGACASACP